MPTSPASSIACASTAAATENAERAAGSAVESAVGVSRRDDCAKMSRHRMSSTAGSTGAESRRVRRKGAPPGSINAHAGQRAGGRYAPFPTMGGRGDSILRGKLSARAQHSGGACADVAVLRMITVLYKKKEEMRTHKNALQILMTYQWSS